MAGYSDREGNYHNTYEQALAKDQQNEASGHWLYKKDDSSSSSNEQQKKKQEEVPLRKITDAEVKAERLQWEKYFEQIENATDEGVNLCRQKNYDGAINVFNKIFTLATITKHGNVYAWRGLCYLRKQEFNKALEDLNTAIYSLSPEAFEERLLAPNVNDVPYVFTWRGLVHEQKGDRNKAVADYKLAADWDWYVQAGAKENSYERKDDETEALKTLKGLGVEYTPQIPQILPETWKKRKPKDPSFSKISTADVTIPNESSSSGVNAQSIMESALASYDKGNLNDALAGFTKTIESGDMDLIGFAYYYRGIVHYKLGLDSKAVSDLKEAIKLGNKQAEEYLNRIESRSGSTATSSQTSQQQSSSSSSTSSTSKGKDTLVKIGLVLVGIFIIYKVLSFFGIIPF